MKRMPWVVLALATACATSQGEETQAAAGTGSAGEPPVVMYRVVGTNSPNPVVQIPYDTARRMGVAESTFASPAMIDELEASCAKSNQAVECRRELQACRFKTCRVVPVH